MGLKESRLSHGLRVPMFFRSDYMWGREILSRERGVDLPWILALRQTLEMKSDPVAEVLFLLTEE